ncbi:hypothetical protein BD324DRAFT_634347 [Kockovaella imperatae]|uniref:Uncharacterized protein n=1 Tax=Kockovaella imperatae TaxID=4999 RepID=A0A1Y1U9G0_9TREE|nr:hypothetical protein BD324DRAFT_634347 [Kockovaella imperatae]ORX34652.1 hypothetical protein BD324DRAFT_634347 [Kockovaella imperatae]
MNLLRLACVGHGLTSSTAALHVKVTDSPGLGVRFYPGVAENHLSSLSRREGGCGISRAEKWNSHQDPSLPLPLPRPVHHSLMSNRRGIQ